MSNIFSYDPDELKQSLIEFYESKPEFADFNYEGSAINTIIDNLVRNTHYIAYMANMVGTESFLDSAQLRANVVSHAQKLSYVPKSRTATTVLADIKVIPSSIPPLSVFNLTAPKGTVFINTVGNVSYSFTTTGAFNLIRNLDGTFSAEGIELKQGQLLTNRYLYQGSKLEIPNTNIDSSTIRVFSTNTDNSNRIEYQKVGSIVDVEPESRVFYLSENTKGLYDIEFGKNILGYEPEQNSIVEIEYVNVEQNHANGIKSLVAATPIGGYSNIQVNVVVEGYGGSERSTNEYIKFLAPKLYQAQNRAVKSVDYKAIMMREFPFIKSANAWGGEENVPPYYGRVFLCAIPQEGFIIANTVKQVIENRIREFSMMTPEVVDPEYILLNLDIKIYYDVNLTSDTFTQVTSKVLNVVNEYTEELKVFDNWFNESHLSRRIKDKVSSIISLEINSVMSRTVPVRVGTNSNYSFGFINRIEPETFKIDDVIISLNASNQRILDDGEGNIVQKYVVNNIEQSDEIGTINYETGDISFTTSLLNSGDMVANAISKNSNIYTARNYVIQIDLVDFGKLDVRGV